MGIPVGINIIDWSKSTNGTLDDDSNVQLPQELKDSQEKIDKEVEEYKPTSGRKNGKKLNLQVEQEQLKEETKKEEQESTKKKEEKEDKGMERE